LEGLQCLRKILQQGHAIFVGESKCSFDGLAVIRQLDRALDHKHDNGRQLRRPTQRTSLLTHTLYEVISLMVLDALSYAYQRNLWEMSLGESCMHAPVFSQPSFS
jgi:hypothetical protein